MSLQISELLDKGRRAGPEVSALDAVMGRDWAIVDFDKARKAPAPQRLALMTAHMRDVARHGGVGGSAMPPGRKPQAMVKMIRGGGTASAGAMMRQMDYLSRGGEEPLERSERYMAAEIEPEEAEAMTAAWRMPENDGQGADRTSHFIVSFPEGTDHDAAYRAGRAWAEELLDSGRFSEDSFDYYTAFHTDRAHPHMHVIVNRRGLDRGDWLKVSQRSAMNYDSMRELVVEVAGREGIHLETSTRLARGAHDRPVQDAEYRRAAEENRDPVAPAHTRETSIRAAAAMIYYARRFAEDAERIERETPEQAALLRRAAEAVSHGRALSADLWDPGTSEQERTMASARIEEKRVEVRENFAGMDRSVASVENHTERMKLLRQVAAMKAEAVPVMRDHGALRDFARPDPEGRYRGMGALRDGAPEIAARQDLSYPPTLGQFPG